MKRLAFLKILFLGLLFSGIDACHAQQSPAATATGTINGANVTIKYSSPRVRGREGKIWGELVPYNKVWRAGANSATVIETDKEISLGGHALPAGKYSIYAIPGETEWTIIINSQTGQWGITHQGETTEDPAKDVFRFTVKPKKSDSMMEDLTYTIQPKGIGLSWEHVSVEMPAK
jgi:hypothetical protein